MADGDDGEDVTDGELLISVELTIEGNELNEAADKQWAGDQLENAIDSEMQVEENDLENEKQLLEKEQSTKAKDPTKPVTTDTTTTTDTINTTDTTDTNTKNFNNPNSRHFYSSVNQNTVAKDMNSVVLPGVDMNADVSAINSGEVESVNGTYTVNGRTYGVHNGTLYPMSGNGVHPLDRGAFKALGVFRTFGMSEQTEFILGRMGITDLARGAALEVYLIAEGLNP